MLMSVLFIVIVNFTVIGSANEEEEDPAYNDLVDGRGELYQDESDLSDAEAGPVDGEGYTEEGAPTGDDGVEAAQAPGLALASYSWAPDRSEERSTKVVNVSAPDNESWSVLETSYWLAVTPAADHKSFSVRIKDKNPGEGPREGKVVIQSGYGGLTREFKVTQMGKPFLRLGTDETWYPTSDSSSKAFQVIADGITWTASVSDWLELGEVKNGKGSAEITVTVGSTSVSRDNGEIRVEGTDIYGGFHSDSIAVEQYLSYNVIDVSNSSITSGDSWRLENGVFYISGDATLTGTSNDGNRVVIDGGTSARPVRVTFQDLTISSGSGSPVQLGSGTHAIIVLNGSNALTGNVIYAGLSTTGANLTIRAGRGSASLAATAWEGAAIGGNGGKRGAEADRLSGGRGSDGSSGGTITIEGGTIIATSTYGAGIGGGKAGNGGYGNLFWSGGDGGNGGAGADLHIAGGVIIAGSIHSAAIGGGRYGAGGDSDLGSDNDGSDGTTGHEGYITLPSNYVFQLGDGKDRRPPAERFSLDGAHRNVKINASLNLFREFYEISGIRTVMEVEVTANDTWSVVEVGSSNGDIGWLEISPMEGTGAGIITITADNNNTGAVRDGFITVNSGGMERKITIVQLRIMRSTLDERVQANIEDADQQIAFSFTPQKRRMYKITAQEYGDNHPYITVFDAGNEVLESGEIDVEYMFEAGETYYILTGLAAEEIGEYQLSIDPYYEQWASGKNYTAGEILEYGTNVNGSPVLYIVLQNHTSAAHWLPGAATSLYKKMEIPEWTQPLNAVDAYPAGEKVMYKGKRWISEIDGNVWAPGTYGWKIFE